MASAVTSISFNATEAFDLTFDDFEDFAGLEVITLGDAMAMPETGASSGSSSCGSSSCCGSTSCCSIC